MFFNKNKQTSDSPASFRPARLSQEALDNFVKKYQSESDPNRISYVTKDGNQICFAISDVLFRIPRSN